jgi:hypothetical protein
MEYKIDFEKKRSGKSQSVDFFINSFSAIKAGVPGWTPEVVAGQAGYRNHFLYEGEIKPLLEKILEKDKDFDYEGFIKLLEKIGAVAPGNPPAFGGGGGNTGTTIDSIERAKEVALEGKAEEVQQLMAQIVELRKEVDKRLKKGFGCSIALKNPSSKKEKKGAQEESPAGETAQTPTA